MRPIGTLALLLLVACSSQTAKPLASESPHISPIASTPKMPLGTGGVVEYAIPTPAVLPANCGAFCNSSLGDLTLGPDGNVWFVDVGRSQVGRITPDGHVAQFSVPSPTGGSHTIAAGPDGNVWLTATAGGGKPDWIVRITPTGVVTIFPAGGSNTAPEGITAGRDGNMWFTEVFGGRIGRMTPSGVLTEFQIPGTEHPRGITMGSDGSLWFTLSAGVGRITTGGQISVFPVANDPSTPLGDIAAGGDGNIWFTGAGTIRYISPKSGQVTSMPLPQGSRPASLISGPDGNIWFTDTGLNAVVRMGTSGSTRVIQLPRRDSFPLGIASGSDGRIWFGESGYATVASVGFKIPEVLINGRSIVFGDGSPKTITVRNGGDASLRISNVRVSGVDAALFIKGADSCGGSTLVVGSTCAIVLRKTTGGAAGIQSATLEITDNATGSPQRLSLVGQAPQCVLPVMSAGPNTVPQGEQLDVQAAQVLSDRSGGFETGTAASGVRATAPPSLVGETAGYFDRPAGRWLPVGGPDEVSPDGSRYVYLTGRQSGRTELHVVDVATASDKVVGLPPDFWSIVGFTDVGVYLHKAYEGIGPGLWLVDPTSGALQTVFSDAVVAQVAGTTAWIQSQNPADTLPQPPGIGGTTDQVMRRDLVTGVTTPWFYQAGVSVTVIGIANGSPIVDVSDGVSTTFWIVAAANQGLRMEFPYTTDRYPSLSGFVGDSAGVWVGSQDGVYLWTPRTGGVLVTDVPVTPAGTCA
ncbi:MAG TPA: hypothetical protein VGG90_00440 [Candidatus Dormibacteraeota bacterium]